MADIFDRLAASNSAATPTPNQIGKTNFCDEFDPTTAVPVTEYSTAELNTMEALSKDPNVPKDSEIGNKYILEQIATKMMKDHLTAGQAWREYQSEQKVNAPKKSDAQYLRECNELGLIPDDDKDLKHLLSIDPSVPQNSNFDNSYALSSVRSKMQYQHLTAGQAWKQYQWEQKVSTLQAYGAITLFGVFVLGAILAAILLIRWIGRMIRTATNRGRYQIQNATPEGCYVLDTTTGEVTWKQRGNQ